MEYFRFEKLFYYEHVKEKLKTVKKMFKNLAYWLETQVNHEKHLKNFVIFYYFCNFLLIL